MMDHLVDGVSIIRHVGAYLLLLVFLYSFARLPFEYRGPWESAGLSIPWGVNLTPKGMVYRKRMFLFVGYAFGWYLAWSLILAVLQEFA